MAELKPVVELAKIQMSKKLEEYKQEGKNLTEKEEAALFSQCIVVQTLVAPATAKQVFIDGKEIPFTQKGNTITFEQIKVSKNLLIEY